MILRTLQKRARIFLALGLFFAFSRMGLGSDTTAHGPIDGPPPPVPPELVSRDDLGCVTMRAARVDSPLVVDGKLEESVYQAIPSVGGFIQQEPQEGELATEKTEVWVLFDNKNIYISARCWDSHPERGAQAGSGLTLNLNVQKVQPAMQQGRGAARDTLDLY